MNQIPPSSLPQRTPRCPDDDRLAAFVEHRLPGAETAQVEAHVATCDYCVGQVSFLLELQDSHLPEVPASLLTRVSRPPASSPWWRLSWDWAPAAAAMAGIVLVASVVLQHEPAVNETVSERPATRQQAPATSIPPEPPQVQPPATALPPETRSQAPLPATPRLFHPLPGSSVNRQAFDLRWAAVPKALFYDVRITSPDGQLKWSSRVESAQVRVPAGASLPAGNYFVWVRAQLPEGKSVRDQAVSFTIQE
jgi:hypothetical protein